MTNPPQDQNPVDLGNDGELLKQKILYSLSITLPSTSPFSVKLSIRERAGQLSGVVTLDKIANEIIKYGL